MVFFGVSVLTRSQPRNEAYSTTPLCRQCQLGLDDHRGHQPAAEQNSEYTESSSMRNISDALISSVIIIIIIVVQLRSSRKLVSPAGQLVVRTDVAVSIAVIFCITSLIVWQYDIYRW